MAYQVTLEEAAVRLPELVQAGQEVVLLNGSRPVAKLTPISDDDPSASETAALTMNGEAFDWLADEPDLYDDTCGEAIHTCCRACSHCVCWRVAQNHNLFGAKRQQSVSFPVYAGKLDFKSVRPKLLDYCSYLSPPQSSLRQVLKQCNCV